jgi:ligand-binding sensor domain-containing protein
MVVMALALCLAGAASAADGWHRPFEVLGPDQGLPNGGITCLTQDADGFIWLGTGNGLLRYEGGHYTRWTRKDGLPSDYVDRLVAIPEGGLWVSTAQGLARFQKGRIEPARTESLDRVAGLSAMALDAAGHLWAATSHGLFVQAQELVFRPHSYTAMGQVLTLAGGRRGAMHVGSARGLFTLHADGSIRSWFPAQGLPHSGVNLVGEDGAGRIWVCTGRELVMKEPGATAFTDHSRLLHAPVMPYGIFFRDRDGSLWLPTRQGTLHLDGAQATLLDAAAGLPTRWVRNVYRDREGGFWILGAVLARLQGNDRVWNHPLIAGPSGGIVWSMTRDPKGNLLVGTDDGLARLSASGLERLPGTEGHRVKSLAFDRTGRLWMVGTLGPTLWLAPGGTRASVAPLGELGIGLNTVMTDSLGQVWIGHAQKGILRWDASQGRLVQEVGPEAAPTGHLGVFQIREDPTGRLWAASNRGLYCRGRSGAWRLFTEKDGLLAGGLYGMAFLPDGSAWVHFNEPQGLMRIRLDGDRLSVLEQRRAGQGQGLRSDLVYAVEVDPQGHTWASTDSGLDCLDTRVHVGRREGMVNEDCDLFSLRAERDHIWVGTSAGLVRYETDDPEPPLPAPQAHILYLLKGEQRLEAPAASIGPVRSGEASLAFRVAVPSYRNEGQVRTQVRLVGLEQAWRDLDAPLTRYQSLPGGAYRFEARAAQPDGAFGPVVGVSFRVLPPWWRTWWALLLWGVAALGLVWLIVRLRVASLARSKAALEALVAKRTEELRDRNLAITDALGRVKQLSGLLPICASCKKIRDDKGYWNQLEHYITDHSEVDFSHGICPDCVGTLFPGYATRHEPESGEHSR